MIDPLSGKGFSALSNNGRVLASAEPAIATVRLFDQVDNTWVQRGATLRGERMSRYGYHMSLFTPPGSVANYRVGKIPVILAIASDGPNGVSVEVFRWKKSDVDWQYKGKVEICADHCGVKIDSVHIGSKDGKVTLAIHLTDHSLLVYYKELSNFATNDWVLGATANSTFAYLTEDGRGLAFVDGKDETFSLYHGRLNVDVRIKSPLVLNGSVGNFAHTNYSKMVTDTGERKASFTLCPNPASGIDNHQKKEVDIAHINPVAMKGTEQELTVISRHDDQSEIFVFARRGTNLQFHGVTFTPPIWDSLDVDSPSVIFATSDRYNFLLRDESETYTSYFHHMTSPCYEVQRVNIDVTGHVAINEDSNIVAFTDNGETTVDTFDPKCGEEFAYFRLSMDFDDHPSDIGFFLDTAHRSGNLWLHDEDIIHWCNGCYGDDDLFAYASIVEEFCIPKEQVKCLRFTGMFATTVYHAAYLEGYGEISNDNDSKNNISGTFVAFANDNAYDDCHVEEEDFVPALCGEEESTLTVELQYDDWGETIWNLTDTKGSLSYSQHYPVDLESKKAHTDVFQICVEKNPCMVWDFADTRGDG